MQEWNLDFSYVLRNLHHLAHMINLSFDFFSSGDMTDDRDSSRASTSSSSGGVGGGGGRQERRPPMYNPEDYASGLDTNSFFWFAFSK